MVSCAGADGAVGVRSICPYPPGPGLVKSWGCCCTAFIAVSLRAFRGGRRVFGVRRGSPGTRSVTAGMPDRRSPVLIVGTGFKGICAVRAYSEGRRPPVRHWGGVRRPAPNKGAQQELTTAKDSQGPVKGDFSSPSWPPLSKGGKVCLLPKGDARFQRADVAIEHGYAVTGRVGLDRV